MYTFRFGTNDHTVTLCIFWLILSLIYIIIVRWQPQREIAQQQHTKAAKQYFHIHNLCCTIYFYSEIKANYTLVYKGNKLDIVKPICYKPMISIYSN